MFENFVMHEVFHLYKTLDQENRSIERQMSIEDLQSAKI